MRYETIKCDWCALEYPGDASVIVIPSSDDYRYEEGDLLDFCNYSCLRSWLNEHHGEE